MGRINYQELYALQDAVMESIFGIENVFYLTGGTCLSRFYHAKRYSDDLDFFTHDDREFRRALREIKIAFRQKFRVVEEVASKDFVRLKIDDALQVDFVNDRTERLGEPVWQSNGYLIDTVENILANKITAIMGRDDAKDVFDLYLIATHYDVNWQEILEAAHKKAAFSNDDLIIRLKTFPEVMLEKIRLIDAGFLNNFSDELPAIIARLEIE